MKNSIALSLFLLISANVYGDMPSREQLIGEALSDYGKVAGGWFLNKRCTFLSESETKEFEGNVAIVTSALGSDLGDPKMLLIIQKSAKKVAESEGHADCGKETKKIVDWGVSHAKNWSLQINTLQP